MSNSEAGGNWFMEKILKTKISCQTFFKKYFKDKFMS